MTRPLWSLVADVVGSLAAAPEADAVDADGARERLAAPARAAHRPLWSLAGSLAAAPEADAPAGGRRDPFEPGGPS